MEFLKWISVTVWWYQRDFLLAKPSVSMWCSCSTEVNLVIMWGSKGQGTNIIAKAL